MKFNAGPKEAARMIQGLGAAGKSVLDDIRKKDPKMAALIEENLVTMEDLQYLTETMLVGLLRDMDLEVFGLSLRTVDQKIVNDLMNKVSTGIKLDIEDGLKGKPRKVSEVEEAQQKVIELLRKKIDLGQIVINPGGEELV